MDENSKNVALNHWRRKVIKSIKAGKGAKVIYEDDKISPALHAAISARLENVKSIEEAQRLFASAWNGYP